MKESKTYCIFRSTITGVGNSCILLVLNLYSRNLFLQYIGIDYLSVAQVINNLLTVVAFSELGITNAVLYMLYQPIADQDKAKIRQIIFLYRRFNQYIGIAVAVVGVLVMPTIPYFISTDVPYRTVQIIYLLNLFMSVSSYYYTYRSVLLSANQQDYISSMISAVISFVRVILQCVVIYLTHDYLLFLMVGILMMMIQNIIVYIQVGRMYPYICNITKLSYTVELERVNKRLKNNVFSMASVKIAAIVINNTDTIVVSWINTIAVGLIANYIAVSDALKSFVAIFQNALIHSVGISVAEKKPNERYDLFQQVLLVNTFIAGVVLVCLAVSWNDFIIIWIGYDYLIDPLLYVSLLLNVAWGFMIATVWIFRDATGLFTKVRHMLLLNALLNLILSVALGLNFGVAGVFFATIIADLVTDFWYDSNIVFRLAFDKNNGYSYQRHVIENMISASLIALFLVKVLPSYDVSIFVWLLKALFALICYGLYFYFRYKNNKYFNIIKTAINRFLKGK